MGSKKRLRTKIQKNNVGSMAWWIGKGKTIKKKDPNQLTWGDEGRALEWIRGSGPGA